MKATPILAALLSLVVSCWAAKSRTEAAKHRNGLAATAHTHRTAKMQQQRRNQGRRVTQTAPDSSNFQEVVNSLTDVIQDMVDFHDKVEVIGQAEGKKLFLAERELSMAIKKSTRVQTEAAENLQILNADAKDLEVNIDGLKSQINEVNKELQDLTKQLVSLRRDQGAQASKATASLNQVDQVIAKTYLRQRELQSKLQEKKTELKTDTSYLHHLGRGLVETQNEDAENPFSFVQANSARMRGSGDDVAGMLQRDRQTLQKAEYTMVESFDAEEKRILGLIEEKKKELVQLEEDLNDEQPTLADKLQNAAEVNRTYGSATRSLLRDQHTFKLTHDKRTLMKNGLTAIHTTAAHVLDLLKMGQTMASKMDASKLMAIDLSDLKRDMPTFVQVASRRASSQSEHDEQDEGDEDDAAAGKNQEETDSVQEKEAVTEGMTEKVAALIQAASSGPFDKVTQMIEGLLASLKDQANQEQDQHTFCMEGLNKSRTEQIKVKRQIDSEGMQIRWSKAAMARLEEQIVFLKEEVKRMGQVDTNSTAEASKHMELMEKSLETNANIKDVVASAIDVMRNMCNLDDDTSLIQQTHEAMRRGIAEVKALFQHKTSAGTSRFDQCKTAVGLLQEGNIKIDELNSDINAYKTTYEIMMDKIAADAKTSSGQYTADLTAANAAFATRKDDLLTATNNLKERKNDLELLLKAEKEMENMCGPGVETREERMARRQDEIGALKNALSVLAGESVPV